MNEKRAVGSISFDAVNVIILLALVLLCVYPFYYMLIYSFSTPSEAVKGIIFLPRGFTFVNYIKISSIKAIPHAALISIARTVIGTFITLLCCSFFAYLVSKPQMYFRKLIYRFVVTTMYISGGLIPTYLVMRAYGLRNTFLIYVLPSAISAYYVILIKTFIEQLPASLEEAAMIEGANFFTCWAVIILPLSKPILATIAVFAAVHQWNEWFDALIYIGKTELYPLQYILYNYLQEAQRMADTLERSTADTVGTFSLTPASVRMTITAVITIPILLVYPFMQRYFIKGIMLGAVKG